MADPTPEKAAADATTAEKAAGAAASGAAPELAPDLAEALAAVADDAGGNAIDDLTGGGSIAGYSAAISDIDLSHLPVHTRSLLKIQVAVTVTLAKQRRPINEITELGPGTIVKFEKTYDEPLELTVGELPIASGDVVKVGDKFGLRIRRLIRPHERFASVRSGE